MNSTSSSADAPKTHAFFEARWLPIKQLNRLEEITGHQYRRGKWSKPELDQLKNATLQTLRRRGLTEEEFRMHLHNPKGNYLKDERFLDLYVWIAEEIKTDRPVICIYHCLKRIFSKILPWTEYEDEKLRNLSGKFAPDWSHIGQLLDRSGPSCRDRYRQMISLFRKGPWSISETKRLLMAVIAHRNGDVWHNIAACVKTRSKKQCIARYQQLSYPSIRNWTRDDEFELVNRIISLGLSHESEIRWNQIDFPFRSKAKYQSSSLRNHWMIMKKRVPGRLTLTSILASLEKDLRPLTPPIL